MKKIFNILFLLFTLLIAGCGGTSSGGSGGGGGDDAYNLGTLSNGSVVQSNANNLAVGNGKAATAIIGINGGSANSSFLFSFNSTNSAASVATVASFTSVPGINVTPSTCNLGTAGTGLNTTCEITVTVESTVPSNTYYIYPTVSGQNTLSPLKILVSNKQTSSSKDITAFMINNVNATIQNNAISIALPYGTSLNSLVASYVTTGVSVSVNGQVQTNGTTANNFTNSIAKPVVYTVTAEDGSTQNYNVVVTTMPNTANDITAFSIGDNIATITGNQIGIQVAHGVPLTSLVATFNTTGSKVVVNGAEQVSGVNQNDFTSPVTYTVYAENGATQVYTVTVTNAPTTDKAITSFEVDGPSNPVLIDQDDHIITAMIPYGSDLTTVTVNFDISGVSMSVNGSQVVSGYLQDFTSPVIYTVTAADGSTQSYTVTVATSPKHAKAITTFALNGFAGVIINNNITVQLPFGTDLSTLVADFDTTGSAVTVNDIEQISGSTVSFANDTQTLVYTVYAADGSTVDYTVTAVVADDSHNDMLSFAIGNNIGTFETNSIIVVELPFGTSLANQVATFTTNGVKVEVNGKEQQSGSTVNDFTGMVTYTVYAGNGSTQTYYALVHNAQSDAKQITAFSINGNDATSGIDQDNHFIFATLPYGQDITQVKVNFDISGKTMFVNGGKVVNGYIQNFTNPVVYTVRAANGTEQAYTVMVHQASNSAKAFTSFSLAGYDGTINESTHTIVVNMGFNTDLTKLVASFTTSGRVVIVGNQEQTSGVTINNFTNPESPVVYTVYAANNSTQDYTIDIQYINTWQYVGKPEFSNGRAYEVSMALNKATNQPYVAFSEKSKASVMRFDGNNWVYVGESGFSSGTASYTNIAVNPATNQPYVVYRDGANGNKATVMTFNGNSWQSVGTPGFSTNGSVASTSIAFNPATNQPYVVFTDDSGISVMAFNGSSWQYVGNAGFAIGGYYPNMAFNPATNQPYVVYQDFANGSKISVMAFNGSSWQYVGGRAFSAGATTMPDIAFNPATNQPYVVYQDSANGSKVSVMAFDGSSWQSVGKAGFSAGTATIPGLAFNPVTNQPCVVYKDMENVNNISVQTFNGTFWQYVGQAAFSPLSITGNSTSLPIVFDNNNRPLVAYSTEIGSSVMEY